MKKLMLAAMAALAITGCSQNEEFDPASQKTAIGFNTIVSKTTRASITDVTTLQTKGFTVYAYTSASEITSSTFPATFGTLMNPALVTYDSGWKSGEYYWPLTDKVHFYAYATDGAVSAYTPAAASTYPKLEYTIADAAADQKDFVVAKLENQSNDGNAIQLAFTHALTQVNFTVQGKDDGFTYAVTAINIANVSKKGTYSFATDQWAAESAFATSYACLNSGDVSINGTESKQLDGAANTLMLMPQAMNAGAKIMVSYSVTKDESTIYQTPEGGIEIKLEGKMAWEAGKKIRYSLTLDKGAVAMQFNNPTVGPWGTSEINGQDTPTPAK